MNVEGQFFDDWQGKHESWSREMMKKNGWYVHYIPDDSQFPNAINFHTHGIAESFGHLDLQICFPLPPTVAHQIFSMLVDNIKEGYQYLPGIKYPEIIQGDLLVEFMETVECGRPVLRIIFPDKDGTYSGPAFSSQFETGI